MSGLRGLRPPKPSSDERRRQARAYEGAFEAVAAVVVAAGAGYFADRQLGSAPVGVLVGVAFGFMAMVLRLVRLGRQLGLTDAPPRDHTEADRSDPEAGAERREE